MGRLINWLIRCSLAAAGLTPDYSLKRGDICTTPSWSIGNVEVIAINWATLSAAINLLPGTGIANSITVVPVYTLTKVKDE